MKATSLVQVENERVLVTEWRFAPGADTGHHVHAHDSVVVPLTSGTLRLEDTARVCEDATLQVGASYARPAGVAGTTSSTSTGFEFRFVEVELKCDTPRYGCTRSASGAGACWPGQAGLCWPPPSAGCTVSRRCSRSAVPCPPPACSWHRCEGEHRPHHANHRLHPPISGLAGRASTIERIGPEGGRA